MRRLQRFTMRSGERRQSHDARIRWYATSPWTRGYLYALLAFLVATGVSVQAQSPGSLSRSLERLASEMADLFPKIEGDVIKVENNQVFIALGAPDQIREGMELSLFRKGEEFKHPLTGVVLGRFEEDLGVLVIKDVSESYSAGNVRASKPDVAVRAGDQVRITKGKIPLAVLPLSGSTPAWIARDDLVERFRLALEHTGRFQVTAADNVRVYLAEKGIKPEGPMAEGLLSRLGEDLRVTYGVLPRIRQVGAESVLEVSLTGVTYQRTLLTSSVILAEPEVVARAPEPSRTRPEVRPGLFKEARKTAQGYRLDLSALDLGKTMKELMALPFVTMSMDVGEVAEEGSEDIVITDGKRVLVYRLIGEEVDLLDEYVPSVTGRILTVQCVELDGKPGQEIIVNQFTNNALNTVILTWRNGRLQVLQDYIDAILLAVDTDGDGVNDTVWGQTYDLNDFFTTGRASRYAMVNGKVRAQDTVDVPKVFRATGVALADLNGDGRRDMVLIDDSRRLRIYRGKEELYRSNDRVGGSYSVAEVKRFTTSQIEQPFPYIMEPWMAVADLDGDGRENVIIARNVRTLGSYLPNVNLYSGGDVVVLSQKEFGYTMSAITPQFDGVVSGVAILRRRSYPAFVMAVSQGTFFGGGNSLLLLSRQP